MHLDKGSSNPNPVNPYNAAAEKTTVAQRSFQLRKKLAKRTAGTQAWAGLGQAPMIGQWMNGGRDSALTEDKRHASSALKDSKIW